MKLEIIAESSTLGSGIWEYLDSIQEELIFKLEEALSNFESIKITEASQGEIKPSNYSAIYLHLAKINFPSKKLSKQHHYNIVLTGGKLNKFAIYGQGKHFDNVNNLIVDLKNKISKHIGE